MTNLNLQTTKTPPQGNKPNVARKVGGGVAGYAAFNAINSTVVSKTNPQFMKKMQGVLSSLTQDDFQHVNAGVTKAFDSTGLKEKGVEIFKVGQENLEEAAAIMKKEYTSKKMFKKMPEILIDINSELAAQQVADGKNAFYTIASNKIMLPKDNKMGLITFHEIGHAMNANFSKIGKVLQKSRAATILALPILLIALCKNKKQEGEQPKNKLDAAGDFVKKHVGILSAAAFAPVLIEEGLATLKGNKLASKVLSPELLKKSKQATALGFATYASVAAAYGVGAFAANKLRDLIAHGRSQKQA